MSLASVYRYTDRRAARHHHEPGLHDNRKFVAFVILKNLLLSLRYLIILLYYSLLIQHMIQHE
jgi:hypothetical protein